MRRVLILLACIGVGAAIAAVGNAVAESQYWILAVPGAIAFAWLFFGDATECEPPKPDDTDSAPR